MNQLLIPHNTTKIEPEAYTYSPNKMDTPICIKFDEHFYFLLLSMSFEQYFWLHLSLLIDFSLKIGLKWKKLQKGRKLY